MTVDPIDAGEKTQLRADARRNREQIVAAAHTIFAEHGVEVPMDQIARAADVGVGTLYRRFPDRDSLIRAVAVHAFRRVLADARDAVREGTDAWNTLVNFLHTATGLRVAIQLGVLSPRAKRILSESGETQRIRDELVALLDQLVRTAQADGSLRGDVGTGDLALILSLILRETGGLPPDVAENAASRYLTLMLDGLQAKPGSPLPGRPVTAADLDILHKSLPQR